MSEARQRDGARVLLVAGARAAERTLLAEVDAALPAGSLPALPVRIVVPSHSLREHLLGRLAERRPAWLGLEVTSLAALARAILERTGGAASSGDWLEGLFAARLATRESALARSLGGLRHGFEEVRGTVEDLLSAGFVAAHLPAVDERLVDERTPSGRPAVARARSLVRVAAGVRRELERRGLAAGADLYLEAARRLAEDPERALPSSAVLVHGFTDATGVASDLLEALVRHAGARVVLDLPPDLSGAPGAWRFGQRLRERLRGAAPLAVAAPAAAAGDLAAPRVERVRTPDPAREARAAVVWLSRDPAARRRPERLAIVARDLAADLPALLAECDRQALPASAPSGPPGALAPTLAALLELLERRGETPIGLVLRLAQEPLRARTGVGFSELGLAFAAHGARTLAAAAALAPAQTRLSVPARLLDDPTSGSPRVESRRVPADALGQARTLLGELLRHCDALARTRRLDEVHGELETLLAAVLPDAHFQALHGALEPLATVPDLVVEPAELQRLLAALWTPLAHSPAGAGGGVALLSVTEARGLTFDRLAVVGLTRDRFPRSIRPDPLLPDALRARLREVLPDLPVKAEGHDEERYLFAQLVDAADEIALSRPLADADGRAVPASPFLDELERAGGPAELATPETTSASALDRAIAAALGGGTSALARPLATALAEGWRRFGGGTGDAERIAAARLASLAEHGADPARPPRADLGPYLGRVGPASGCDPRHATPSVTTLERLAGCGWQVFLERCLRLGPLPEIAETIPSLPGRLAGSVLHGVLERLLPEHVPGSRMPLATALAAPPRTCRWPSESELARLTATVARRELDRAGLDAAAFEAPLVRDALAGLAVVRETDWASGSRELLAVEAQGEAEFALPAGPRRVAFVLDRLERAGEELLATDYKTGRPLSAGKQEKTRLKQVREGLARGERLQLPVYLRGLGERTARARYLQVAPDLDPSAREIALDRDAIDAETEGAVLTTLFAVWDEGAFVPRLLETDGRTTFPPCEFCAVREACLQGDSGARLRLSRWADDGEGRPGSAFDRAAREWWALRRPPSKGSSR